MGSIRGLICFIVNIVVHACGYESSEHKNPISSTVNIRYTRVKVHENCNCQSKKGRDGQFYHVRCRSI